MKIHYLICALLFSLSGNAQIRIICTAALSNNFYKFRKKQYIQSLTILNKMGYGQFVYVTEALNKKGPTFLDDYCSNVFYAQSNDWTLGNYGINEIKTMIELIEHYKFAPNDMLIKLTGRYQLHSEHLLRTARRNTQYNAIVKFMADGNQIYTSGFAMRCKDFLEMVHSFDFNRMETEGVSFEVAAGAYIKEKMNQKLLNVYLLDKLDLYANFYGSSFAGRTGIEIQ